MNHGSGAVSYFKVDACIENTISYKYRFRDACMEMGVLQERK